MKANCRRRRHSRRTVAHIAYTDLFLLAQWQSNSSHESWLAAQAATPARPHLGADGDPDAHADPQARRPSRRRDDHYDVLENGVVVGRIFKAQAAPQDRPWMWRAGIVPTASAALHTAMPKRARRRWRCSARFGENRAGGTPN